MRVNEEIRRDPEAPVRLEGDRVRVDGRQIEPEGKIYLVMNKPRNVVTTASDEKGRDTVYTILARSGKARPWVAPVGRLDKASEGLLLLTNDSEWGARIAAPGTHLDKTYHVQIASTGGDVIADAMMKGSRVGGDFLNVKRARPLRAGEKNCWLEVVLDEGKNRQIRRILSAMNIEVLRLVRVAIGPLELGPLPKGACRMLSAREKQLLDRAMDDARKQERHG